MNAHRIRATMARLRAAAALLAAAAHLFSVDASAWADYRTAADGGNGGSQFSFRCPPDNYLVGFQILTGSWLDGFAAYCTPASNDGKWALVSSDGVPNVRASYDTGGNGGISGSMFSCPADHFVRGISVRTVLLDGGLSHRYLFDFTAECDALLSGHAFWLRPGIGHTAEHPPILPTRNFVCDQPGALAVGVYGRSGVYIDRLGLICDTANFWPRTKRVNRLPPPIAPAGVFAINQTPNEVIVHWTDTGPLSSWYEVERQDNWTRVAAPGVSSAVWVLLQPHVVQGGSAPNFVDRLVHDATHVPRAPYTYRVCAVGIGGRSCSGPFQARASRIAPGPAR